MATLADILASRRNPQTDPRPWDAGQGIGQAPGGPPATMPAQGPPPGAPGAPDQIAALAARQQAFAQGAAPGTAALQAAPLGSLKPNAQGNVEVPQGIWAQIMQRIMGGGTSPAGR